MQIKDLLIAISEEQHIDTCVRKEISVSVCQCQKQAAQQLLYEFSVQKLEQELETTVKINISQKADRKKIHFFGYNCGSKNPKLAQDHNHVTCSHCLKAIHKHPSLITKQIAETIANICQKTIVDAQLDNFVDDLLV